MTVGVPSQGGRWAGLVAIVFLAAVAALYLWFLGVMALNEEGGCNRPPPGTAAMSFCRIIWDTGVWPIALTLIAIGGLTVGARALFGWVRGEGGLRTGLAWLAGTIVTMALLDFVNYAITA